MAIENNETGLDIPESCSKIVISGFPMEISFDYDALAGFSKYLGGEVATENGTMTINRGGNNKVTEDEAAGLNLFAKNNPECAVLFY